VNGHEVSILQRPLDLEHLLRVFVGVLLQAAA
jgi:hypothetical protein